MPSVHSDLYKVRKGGRKGGMGGGGGRGGGGRGGGGRGRGGRGEIALSLGNFILPT